MLDQLAPDPAPPDDQAKLSNATAAAAEFRASIDHQIKGAADLDTKLSALITVIGAVAGLIAAHLHLETQGQLVAFLAVAIAAGIAVALAFAGLQPRAASFGVDPGVLESRIGRDREAIFRQQLAAGLVNSYATNRGELITKARCYRWALGAFFVALLLVGPLIATQAVQ